MYIGVVGHEEHRVSGLILSVKIVRGVGETPWIGNWNVSECELTLSVLAHRWEQLSVLASNMAILGIRRDTKHLSKEETQRRGMQSDMR
jgi:hypothetical protein